MTRTTALLLATAIGLVATAAVAHPMWGGGRGGEMRGPGGMQQMFESFDIDGDGRITQVEIDTYRSDRHAKFDANDDGVVDLQEFEALWLDAMQTPMIRRFQFLDANADGSITVEEFEAPFVGMVGRLDTAEDGVLTQDDLKNMRRDRGDGPRGHGGDRRRPGPDGAADQ